MHDGVYFEKAGIPTAVCTTTEFANAARAQADALGLTAFNVILVEHPVQPLTRDQVRERAETVFDRVVEKLTAG